MAKKPRIYGTFGPFVFAYPHITSPDTEGTYADNKYKVDAVGAANSAGMVKAQEACAEALKAFGLPKKGTNLPIKRETVKNDAGKKEETGKLFLRSKSQYAPTVVDASGNPIADKVLKKLKIGAGSEGLIEGYFSPYETTERVKDKETGEVETITTVGISFTLTGVQLIKLVKGGTGGSSFGAYEGGGFSASDLAGDDDDDDDAAGDTGGDDVDDDGGLDI